MVEHRESECDPGRMQLRYPIGNNHARSLGQSGSTGQQGSRMPVCSQAQQHQVKAGPLAGNNMKKLAQSGFAVCGGKFRLQLSFNSVNVRCGYGNL
jgi:hypothetical protein